MRTIIGRYCVTYPPYIRLSFDNLDNRNQVDTRFQIWLLCRYGFIIACLAVLYYRRNNDTFCVKLYDSIMPQFVYNCIVFARWWRQLHLIQFQQSKVVGSNPSITVQRLVRLTGKTSNLSKTLRVHVATFHECHVDTFQNDSCIGAHHRRYPGFDPQ